jgi:tRNA dimethylallyltransferase
MKDPLFIITGCTGSGKSNIIQQIPQDWPITIINADSRQIYEELKIGTAIPSIIERTRFPHCLFATVPVVEKYSAGKFMKDALVEIKQSLASNRLPILVGGTFFYIRSLLDGIAPEVEIRPELLKQAESMNLPDLKNELARIDPVFLKGKTQDKRRVERAYCYSVAAGSPFSQAARSGGIAEEMNIYLYEVYRERDDLYQRINNRVSKMLSDGLINEVKRICEKFPESPGLDTIGYREIHARILKGLDPDSVKNDIELEIAQNTRRFAKRQRTWFKSEKRIKRFDHDSFLRDLDIQINNIVR